MEMEVRLAEASHTRMPQWLTVQASQLKTPYFYAQLRIHSAGSG